MTHDHALALSLCIDLARTGLTERLLADDPQLLELAAPLLERARAARTASASSGMHVLAWNDARFPAALLAITDAPPALWYRGTLECLAAPIVAIVGSRAASAVALQAAEQLGAGLAAAGVTVVSGLARGVDSAAHRGALRHGRTIAVLGSGLGHLYPREHAPLAAEIERTGLVVSEYPPATPPLPQHFPMRNRLISGLARGVVVIEASEKSGSLITASCALQQGREVMAVPGNVLSGRNRGGHALLRDGARIVESAADILEELGLPVPPRSNAGDGDRPITATGAIDPVLRRMDVGQPYDLDMLAGSTGMEMARLLPRLLDLEIRGLLRRVDGGRFMRPA
jgi:DNA processing protein